MMRLNPVKTAAKTQAKSPSWLDLITDANGHTLSHTKLWANVAFAVACFAFGRMSMGYTVTAPSEVWWAFLGCVGASGAASKLLSLKYGVAQPETDAASGSNSNITNTGAG